MSSIFFRTVIIYALLSLSMRLMGKRQIGELEAGELISALLISEICSIPIDDSDIPLLNAFIPVLFIVSTEIIISFYKNKSTKLKKIFDGEPIYIIKDGKIDQRVLYDNRISTEEIYTAIRQNGYSSLSEISALILEPNGKISVIKARSDCERIVISDGEISYKELNSLGLSEHEIREKIGRIPLGEIFLMTADKNGITNIIKKEEYPSAKAYDKKGKKQS